MSLKFKLLGSMAVVVVVAILASYFAISGSAFIGSSIRSVEMKSYPLLEKIFKLEQIVYQSNYAFSLSIEGDVEFVHDMDDLVEELDALLDGEDDPMVVRMKKDYHDYVTKAKALGIKIAAKPDDPSLNEEFQNVSNLSLDLTHTIEAFAISKSSEMSQKLGQIESTSESFKNFQLMFSLCLVVVVSVVLALIQNMTKSLSRLASSAVELRDGRLDTEIHQDRKDELGTFQKTFDSMRSSLKDMIENLDRKVKERTSDLVKTQGELQNTLDSIKQAIVTVNPDMSLHEVHSKMALELFQKDSLEGVKLDELLRCSESQKQDLQTWLKVVRAPIALRQWDKYSKLNPIHELVFEDTHKNQRYVKIEYAPVLLNEKLERIMVLGTDLTEEKRVKEALNKEQKRNLLEMERILAINECDEIEFSEFSLESEQIFQILNQDLACFKEDGYLQAFSRRVHTFRGCMGSVGFMTFADKLNRLEVSLSDQKSSLLEGVMQQDMKYRLDLCLEEWGEIRRVKDKIFHQREDLMEVNKEQYWNIVETLKSARDEVSRELYEKVFQLHLKPFETYGKRYEKLMSIWADRKELAFDFVLESNGIHMAKNVMQIFDGAIIHLLRNSMAHGLSKDKQDNVVTLSLQESQGAFEISISDNGQGIDLEKIRSQLIAQGDQSQQEIEALPEETLLNWIFKSGFSTSEEKTEDSGFGLGLSAVKEDLEAKGGQILVQSEWGKGTRFILSLPKDLSH